MPGNAVAPVTAPRNNIDFARTLRISDSHTAPGERVSEVGPVKVALVPNTRRERAPENPLMCIFVKIFANRDAVPSCLQRIGKS